MREGIFRLADRGRWRAKDTIWAQVCNGLLSCIGVDALWGGSVCARRDITIHSNSGIVLKSYAYGLTSSMTLNFRVYLSFLRPSGLVTNG